MGRCMCDDAEELFCRHLRIRTPNGLFTRHLRSGLIGLVEQRLMGEVVGHRPSDSLACVTVSREQPQRYMYQA